MLKHEIKRLFLTKSLYWIITLSIALGLIGLYSYYMDIYYFKFNKQFDSISAYDAWLYCLGVAPGSFLKILFPLLIAIPICDSYLRDKKSGYLHFLVTRGSYKKYITAKFIVNGVTGAIVMTATLVVLLVICCILFPLNAPNTDLNLKPTGVMSSYYSLSPMIYVLFILSINLIFGVLYSILGFTASFVFTRRLTIVVFPFFFFLIVNVFSQLFHLRMLLPTRLIVPFDVSNTQVADLASGYLLVIITIIIFTYQFKKNKSEEIL
jgi:hypothetical protein